MLNNFWVTIPVTMGVTTLLVIMLSKWKSFCNNFGKMIYTTAIGLIVVCLLGMGGYAIHKSFQPHPVRIENSSNAPIKEMVSVESYKATYDLFSTQFSQLLTFLGFFGTIFGLIIPAGAYLLQRQSLEDERKKYEHDLERLKKDFEKKISETEERFNNNTLNAKEQIEDSAKKTEEDLTFLKSVQNDLFAASQTTFDAITGLVMFLIDYRGNQKPEITLFRYMLVSFDNAVDCAVKAQNKENLVRLVKTMCYNIENYYRPQYEKDFQKAVDNLKIDAKKNKRFVSGEEIRQALGEENTEWYGKYKEIYAQIYPWKFDGTQKKD